ncbi:NAD-P-binding protein [Vararia minispora EC-137]|uniref:NAD-P-binding protein n=1 Tax=Vararia minispora EC-137 TaxID=1314806 RepID=A0ACB8QM24_9AGAM|nr:NAD-P-binding protein [Vararia minispora EC-137]
MSTNTVWRLPSGAGISALKKVSEPLPSPLPHQYLVRIHATSLNFRDIVIASGTYPLDVKENVVLGGDLAGEIVEAGSAAAKFKVGDHVTLPCAPKCHYGQMSGNPETLGGSVDGALQEYIVLDEADLLRAPSYLSYDELSCFPIAGVTAWNAFFGGGTPLKSGQTALFQGTGGVSIFGLQIARTVGAQTIITTSSDEKAEIAKKLGATHVINYKKTPDWEKEVKRLTNGVGAHHIFDNVGIAELERCYGAVAHGGTISHIGFLGGAPEKAVNTPILAIMSASQTRGILGGSKQQLEELLAFSEVHQIHPYIHKVFEFDQSPQALEYLQEGRHVGKIVVRVGSQQ